MRLTLFQGHSSIEQTFKREHLFPVSSDLIKFKLSTVDRSRHPLPDLDELSQSLWAYSLPRQLKKQKPAVLFAKNNSELSTVGLCRSDIV